jgi:hypothetical protein
MKPSCIDCEEFPTCRRCTQTWRKSWREYPPSTVPDLAMQNLNKRLELMQTQYRICHEKQMTFQTFKRPERAF